MYVAALLLAAFAHAHTHSHERRVHPIHPIGDSSVIWQFDPPEPGLNEEGGWINVDALGGEITSAYGAFSAPNALVLSASYQQFQRHEGEVVIDLDRIAGLGGSISLRLHPDGFTAHAAIQARVRVYDLDPDNFYGDLLSDSSLTADAAGPSGFYLWEAGSFVPTQNGIVIQISVGDPARLNNTFGRWVIDDVIVVDAEEADMSKRREVRNAIIDRIKTVTVANGYALTLEPTAVVKGPVLFPTGITSWPHVAVTFGEFTTEHHTMGGRMKTLLQCRVGLACQDSSTTKADDQCDDLYAEITNALCVGPRDSDVNSTYKAPWLGLSYVDEVTVSDGDPADLPPDVARGMALLQLTVSVAYHHHRRQV